MLRYTILAILAVAAFAAPPSQIRAQDRGAPMVESVDPALLNGLNFRQIGPGQGGRSTTVTGVPSQPTTFYMGVASGGLFRTTDNGESWVPITDGKVPLGPTGAIDSP